jgi:hypothetical protein
MSTTKKVLILAASPKDRDRLRLGAQVRDIHEGLKLSKKRDQFMVSEKWAIRLRDIRRAMLEFEPHIVHFCGHGEGGKLIVENDSGNAIQVNSKALSGLFKLFSDQIECVLLNASFSKRQADAIVKHIDYVIGMNGDIQSEAAIEFAVGFYDALGAGKSYDIAFEFACNAIQLFEIPSYHVPFLKIRTPKYTGPVKEKFETFIRDRYKGEVYSSTVERKDISMGCFFYWESTSKKFRDYRDMEPDYHFDMTKLHPFRSLQNGEIAYYIQEATHDNSIFIATLVTKINHSEYTIQIFTNWKEYADSHPFTFNNWEDDLVPGIERMNGKR